MSIVMVLFAFALVFGLGHLNGRQAERRDASPHQHAKTAKNQAERACIGPDPGAVFECIYEKVEASEETARTEQDLTAQQRAAWAALAGAIIGAVALLVTAVGVWFVKRTLDATLEAVEDTSQATKAMERQNEIAEDTAKRQLRAYVHLKSADLTLCTKGNFPTASDHPDQRFADVEIKNYGLTPARNMVSVCSVGVRPFPPKDHRQPLGPIPDWVERASSELPPERVSGLPIEVSSSGTLHERLMSGELAVYFYAEVTYEDVFGEKHSTRISLMSHGIAYKRGSFVVTKEGNDSD